MGSMKRSFAGGKGLKALSPTRGVKEPSVLFSALLDHLVRPCQHVRRNREADLLGGMQVDKKLEICGLFHRQVSRLGTFKDLVYVGRGAVVQVANAWPIRHKPALLDKLPRGIHRRQTMR